MAAGSRTSFQKRQKEIARMEKQREKAAKRLERKRMAGLQPSDETTVDDATVNPEDAAANPPDATTSPEDDLAGASDGH